MPSFGLGGKVSGHLSHQGAAGGMSHLMQHVGLTPPGALPTARNSLDRPAKQKKQPWTLEEKKLFKEALDKHGPKALKEISEHVGTRTLIQCRSHL